MRSSDRTQTKQKTQQDRNPRTNEAGLDSRLDKEIERTVPLGSQS